MNRLSLEGQRCGLPSPVSPHRDYCDGFGNPESIGHGYVVALTLAVGIAPKRFGHVGSDTLDKICAFDAAEAEVNIGQINMITVSSFAGRRIGCVWGYDMVKPENLFTVHPLLPEANAIYSAEPLVDAAKALFGSIEHPRFPLMPGSHVQCATSRHDLAGPGHIYCAIALGIAASPGDSASLIMEEVGEIPRSVVSQDMRRFKRDRLLALAASVRAVGVNQRVQYDHMLVAIRDQEVREGEVGCALVAAPYFTLARDAIPSGGMDRLAQMRLSEWEKEVLYV